MVYIWMHTPGITSASQHALTRGLGNLPVTREICTHMPPDHVGTPGWLTRRFGCPLWMTRVEYVICHMLVANTHRDSPADALRFYRAAGRDDAAMGDCQARYGGCGRAIFARPTGSTASMTGNTSTSVGITDAR